jgi:micrococcal nuclease
MSRRFRRSRIGTILCGIVLGALVVWRLTHPSTGPHSTINAADAPPLAEGRYRVEYVVDGDTLKVTASPPAASITVRLIGVDTPETVKREHPVEPFGPEATQFARDFLAGGEARLQFDRERLDVYGRTLAYVWVDDKMLNEELLRAGLARYEPQFHYSDTMKRRFRKAEGAARTARIGIWSSVE